MTEEKPVGKSVCTLLAVRLTNKRNKIDAVRAQIEKAEEDLKKLKSYQAIETLRIHLEFVVEEAREIEKDLRSTALDVAVELQTKNPAPGVTITKKTTFSIDQPITALEACRQSYPQLIEEKIKKIELKKIVVALGEAIAGTTLTEDEYGQVRIATNLSEHYLDDNAPPF